MKILNLIQCLNLGGMEQASYILIEETQGKVIDWQVQSVTPVGMGKDILSSLNIPIYDNPYEGKFGYKSHLSLKKKVNNFSGDIILVTGPTLTSCMSVKSHPCTKKVLSIHFCHKNGLLNLLKWKAFYQNFHHDYQAIIYHSPYILEEAIKIAPQIQHKFHLIENCIQRCSATTVSEKNISRQHLGIPADSFIIGNAGWLIERKRFDIFLEVCAQLSKHLSNDRKKLIFLIAGDGPLHGELETLASSLNISNQVKWIGWQKDLSHFYQSLDLLLFNSDSDAFGRTVLEAMGYGVPVVASVVEGGTDAVLCHKNNGYLIQEHNIRKLTEYCLNLIYDNKTYEQFQIRSLNLIESRFTTEKFIQKYLDVFTQVLNY
ncbi:glycosyltransferase family 4 protein [Dendronalium sp. ChiSLP03b]|uniref:glycosyltransferase family 4 protein n=1 Tax=Dendronalium sp. ChiSLP03b TaxID=3075381 RepID=UPI002AD1E17C|nr:glycosyltransferase family 4 protein [Dendronalium sp. ChiSLP03b]MDZ8204879.1 glycosyltransferase family 4 protein [Dendronalium sp. ChiSLP03b]